MIATVPHLSAPETAPPLARPEQPEPATPAVQAATSGDLPRGEPADLPHRPESPSRSLVRLQARIYREARAARDPLPQIMHWVLDQRNLDAAWRRVSTTDGANTPGVDGQTAHELEGRSAPWLARLAREISTGTYAPLPPRWLEFEKSPGSSEYRRLGILALRDRVVHAAFKQVLEPILEPGFLATSFGFRPGRSVAAALAEAVYLLEPQGTRPAYPWAAQLDVAQCFDTVDHSLLLEQLAQATSDPQALELLDRLLAAGGSHVRHWFRNRRVGLIQGSPLSPLLCNLYLHPVDQALDQLARTTQGGVRLLRYADDLLLLARDASLGRQALATLRTALSRRRQHLKRRKTRMGPAHHGISWLGVLIRPRTNPWTGTVRFGYVVPDAKVHEMLDRIAEMTSPPSSRIDAAAFDPGRWIVSINTQLRQWYEAYQFTDNGPEVFQTIDEFAFQRVGLLLRTITGLRPSGLARLKERLPRGFLTWQVAGVRLVVLSALAPRRPARLVHRPAWQKTLSADTTPLRVRHAPSPHSTHRTSSNKHPHRPTQADPPDAAPLNLPNQVDPHAE